ncbi:MAG: S-methyl-5'-thioinosine phosphorylase [Dokdonella sp.]|uniref:S-methyl-5'-thioinosine phosphorylase n=1 Tax=Dokdonella sp. TaxID=2291710 RepID=UPI002CEBACF5|nr:S-methyl-5'-thioinosine phosphorylase [Dokdonella sp.]HOX71058.1 S-methyl-5'-thioinosine phosphorylase [Dokdonella sp.]HPG94204.1 S-methyl-5'-thioinosine phosphorylase [Dokdonella sp.]HPN79929.1 S-methyl-5'-thioinosine phosphorylase [Dokdonella sp.]
MSIDLALIGGTGLYRLPGLEEVSEQVVETPWGKPSDAIVCGNLGGRRLAFIARHGRAHDIAPHQVNYRANLHALKQLGAMRIVGINAVGGIREDMGPRALVVPDQIIDYTHGRITSFCDGVDTPVQHIDFSEPYTASMRRGLLDAALQASVPVVDGGCYGATQGPRLETRAEIGRMRRDGCDLVGMTGMPEAALARELGLEYACLALVANWAAGCGDQAEISLDEIFANLEHATAKVPLIVASLIAS